MPAKRITPFYMAKRPSIFSNKEAWKEVISDTLLGLAINFPLNVLLLYIAFSFNMGVLGTSIFLALAFTVVAIIRKYFVRVYFEKHINTDK